MFVNIMLVVFAFLPLSINALQKVTIELKWFHQFQFAGIYAAKEKGFYLAQGIDVQIVERDKKSTIIKDVLSNKVQFGISDSTLVKYRLQGNKIIILAAIFQHSPLVLISLAKHNILTPQELKNKKIMYQKNIDNAIITSMFNEQGIKQQDFIFITHNFKDNALLTNYTDVMSAYLGNQTFFYENKRKKINIINPANYGLDQYGDLLFTSEYFFKNNQELTLKFRMATIKGWQYALNHPLEITKLILNKYSKIKSKAALLHESKYVNQMISPNLIEVGHINKNRFAKIEAIYKKLDHKLINNNLDGFFYFDHIKTYHINSYVILSILILGFIIFILYKKYNHVISLSNQDQELIQQRLNKLEEMKFFLGLGSFGLWEWYLQENCLVWDDAMYKIYGISESKFTSAYEFWADGLHPDDKLNAETYFNIAIQGGTPFNTKFRIRLPSGEIRYIRALANIKFDSNGQAIKATGVNWDVTRESRRENMYKSLSIIQSKYLSGAKKTDLFMLCIKTIIELTESNLGFIGYILTNKAGLKFIRIICVNSTSKDLIKNIKLSSQKNNRDFFELNNFLTIPIKTGEAYLCNSQNKLITSKEVELIKPLIKSYMGIPIYSTDGLIALYGVANRECGYDKKFTKLIQPIAECLSSIISTNKNLAIIENLAQKDKLTKLYNRNFFEETFDKIINSHNIYKQKFAILLIDLNDFKKINDIYGHDVGDSILRMFSERMLSVCSINHIIARIGGDEFIVIAKNLHDYDEARVIANQIYAKSKEIYYIQNKKINSQVSIGIATYPETGESRGKLLKNADLALYKSKISKNKIQFFSDELEKKYVANFNLENELIKAFKKSLIYFNYQPIIDLKTKKIVGCEMLARWENTILGGQIDPEKFIKKIENMGLANEMNFYVVKNVIKDFKDCLITDKFKLSINISPKVDMFDKHLYQIISMLDKANLKDNFYFSIELTESAFLSKSYINDRGIFSSKIKKILSKKRLNNIFLAIDDFGIDSSSPLRFLNNEFTILKIDKAFVDKLVETGCKKHHAFIEAIISMCNKLNVEVIAEGIEHCEQEKYLLQYNCQLAQGYLYYKPLKYEELIQELKYLE